MKSLFALGILVAGLVMSGCVVAPPVPVGGSVTVYGEYPAYGHGGYYHHYDGRWHHPYDRDRYFYRY